MMKLAQVDASSILRQRCKTIIRTSVKTLLSHFKLVDLQSYLFPINMAGAEDLGSSPYTAAGSVGVSYRRQYTGLPAENDAQSLYKRRSSNTPT
jgi:hypothetical protein